ncbi:unnamed protein product [Ambrosiozyma monospora]|uniref:B-related factor 1 n=1 Tax=Ambrosiozyma monospora TaxID=43982 RepID=A0A9W6YX23_AMBMO|nr:unnamed protein product [Ambrosiozyma monospora]
MSKQMKCKNCGNTEFSREYLTASSDLACTNCGAVIEDNPIVSEVTFAESSSGAATVQGAFVGSDQARANFGNNRGSLDSREQTLSNGKKRIKNVAIALGIPDFVSDAAYQWFQLALTNNFVQGRRSQNVVAACLYVACRKEKTHHMLIDFSSRLQVSVYAIGATFLKMVKALHITNLPLVDPSLFIQHFGDKLDFGKKKLKVINDAVKLAHRMSNDWIFEGRRPAGVAGACLLLAARMNNFRRTHSEIVAITHVSESTIQQRLLEFRRTGASSLTVDEFRNNAQVQDSLPPSFTKGRRTEKKRKRKLAETNEESLSNDPILNALLEDSDLTEDEIQKQIRRILKKTTKEQKRGLNSRINKAQEVDLEIDQEDDVEQINKVETELERMIEKNRPRNLTSVLPTTEQVLSNVSDGNISDLEDPEIDSCLLTEAESKLKEQIWVGSNQDYLLEQENKRLKEEADKIAGHTTHVRKKKRKKVDGQGGTYNQFLSKDASRYGLPSSLGGAFSAADSAKSMIQQKSLSKKINYAAVNELFDE